MVYTALQMLVPGNSHVPGVCGTSVTLISFLISVARKKELSGVTTYLCGKTSWVF